MSNIERGLFIYRPVSLGSLPRLKKLQAEYAKIETFRPIEVPHLTLLQGGVLPMIRGRARDGIIEAAPETAEEPYGMRVVEPRFHRGSYGMSRLAIALMLNDEDGHYREEYQTFRDLVAKKSDRDAFIVREPHVTIGYFRPDLALISVLQTAEKLNDQTIRFDPIESNVGKVKPIQKPKSVSSIADIPVRTVSPGSIPANFLASLKSSRRTQ